MTKFNPSPKTLVVNELIERGYTIDYDDALRICHELEEEQQTHHKAAIGLTTVGIIGAGTTLVFCGVVAPLLVSIAAIGVGAMGVWNHPIRAARRDDEADFLRANPSIVSLIENRLQSGEAPFKVAAAYLECFRAWRNTGQPLALPSVGNVPVDEATAQTIATSSPIGNQTKLGAVEVPSSPAVVPSIPTGLSIIVSDPYQSRAFFGAQRTGKSYLAAVASRQISESLRCQVYHINLASFGDEDSYYWSHAVKSLCCDLSSLDGYEASLMIKRAIELVKEFYSTENAILIVDEVAYCGSSVAAHKDALADFMRIIADKITTLSSSGKKRMQAIWTIAPEFVAGALTQDAKAVKKLKLCYVSVHPDVSLDWQGQEISFDWELFNQIKANYTINDPICVPSQDRICFIGSNWIPVGALPDLKKGKSTKLEAPIADPIAHLENSLMASDDAADDVFSKFAATLTHESQASLKAFVLWLGTKKGSEVSYEQIKDSFARRADVGRNKEAIMPLVYAAKSKKLITFLSNSNWLVSSG